MPAGRWSLIPFAVAGNLAVRGSSIAIVVVPPVGNPEAVRIGADVRLSWEWPEGLRLARVAWRIGDAEDVQELTFAEYRNLGYVPRRAARITEVQISGVVRLGAKDLVSAPVTVPVKAQAPTLTFHAYRVRPWQLKYSRPYRLHGPRWWCERRRIVIRTDLPCSLLRLQLYVRTPGGGPVPEIPVLTVDDLELGPDRPHEVTLSLPDLSAMDQPRYLACRASTVAGPVRVNEFASTGREIRPCSR
jgi:hypothetical protein